MSYHPIHSREIDDGTHESDDSEATIMLGLSRDSDRRRIKEWLSKEYTIITSDGGLNLEIGPFDLCILDAETITQHRQKVETMAHDAQPEFHPVLLLSSGDGSGIASDLWTLVDDVVEIPAQKETLARRIDNLLDKRRLSAALAYERNQAESLFKKVFENSSEAICIVDYNRSRVIDCNDAATDLLGYSGAELQSMSIEAVHGRDSADIKEFLVDVITDGQGSVDDVVCKTKDGEEIPVALSSAYIELDGRPMIINTIRDISERKERERRRKRSDRFRERLDEITSDPTLSFDGITDQLLQLGQERLEVENAHLVRIEPANGVHDVLAATGSPIVEAGTSFDLSETFCRRTIHRDGALAIHDTIEDGWEDDPAYLVHDIGCYVGAKITVDDELYGTVCFVDRSPRDTQISSDEKTFIELIARWLGYELERAAHRDVLRSLHEVSVELMGAHSIDEITGIATRALEGVYGVDIGGVRLLDESGTTLRLAAATEQTYELIGSEPAQYAVGEGIVGEAFEENQPRIVGNLEAEETPVEYGPIRSAMCIPLGSHGILSLGSTEADAFESEDLDQVNILASVVSAALARIEREDSLLEAHEYRSKLFDNATDCIVDATFEENNPIIRDVNSAFETVFGLDASEIRGKPIQDVIVPESKVSEAQSYIDRALRGERFETEVRRETVDGMRDFLLRVVPVAQDGTVTGGYAVYTDITNRKRREQQVQVLNRILRHNLRNKVNVMHGQATRIVNEIDREYAHAARAIEEAAAELMSLTEKTEPLRKMITAESDPTERSSSWSADVVPVRDLMEELRADSFHIPDGVDVSIQCEDSVQVAHPEHLRIALTELVDNAIAHTERTDLQISITVATRGGDRRWVDLTVTDNGPGIPVDEIEVFESEGETPLHHSSGLGLWMVKWLVRSAGGEIDLDITDNQGTTFTISLPVQGRRAELFQPQIPEAEWSTDD